MVRPLRIEFEGAYYHILSRGNNRASIFKKKQDYLDFLDLLEEMSDRFSITIYAYVLMGNHYHLLLQTRYGNLSKAMQWIGTTYTRRFNIRHKQGGHLFQGRFKSILIESDKYLINLSCYIHRNPLRAKMVKRLSDYKYSSYLYYAYDKGPPGWLNVEPILAYFGHGRDRYQGYQKKVQTYSQEPHSIWEDVKFGFIYGSQSFIDRIKKKYLSDTPDKELPQLNQFLRSQGPDKILKKAENILACKVADFKEARRLSGKDRDKRDMIAWILWESGNFNNRQIGELLGLTDSSVSRRLRHIRSSISRKKDSGMLEILDQLRAIIKV